VSGFAKNTHCLYVQLLRFRVCDSTPIYISVGIGLIGHVGTVYGHAFAIAMAILGYTDGSISGKRMATIAILIRPILNMDTHSEDVCVII
jgi:hypothetical protein